MKKDKIGFHCGFHGVCVLWPLFWALNSDFLWYRYCTCNVRSVSLWTAVDAFQSFSHSPCGSRLRLSVSCLSVPCLMHIHQTFSPSKLSPFSLSRQHSMSRPNKCYQALIWHSFQHFRKRQMRVLRLEFRFGMQNGEMRTHGDGCGLGYERKGAGIGIPITQLIHVHSFHLFLVPDNPYTSVCLLFIFRSWLDSQWLNTAAFSPQDAYPTFFFSPHLYKMAT